MEIRIFENPHDAGIYVAALAEQVIQREPNPVLGLATGSTPIPFYDALIQMHKSGLDLSRVTTINLDEYIGLAPSHPQSYTYFMNEKFFSHTNIKKERIHIPRGDCEDLNTECRNYDEVIIENHIHFQIVGIGLNGHIGFNEPQDLLVSKTHIVELSPETLSSNARFFKSVGNVPRKAITMGVQAILQADQIVLMAFGMEKADIVARAVNGDIRTDVPASILQLHKNVTVVLDSLSAMKVSL